MFRAHVLIVRREKLYYTVSGIITRIGGRPVMIGYGFYNKTLFLQFVKNVPLSNKTYIYFPTSVWVPFLKVYVT